MNCLMTLLVILASLTVHGKPGADKTFGGKITAQNKTSLPKIVSNFSDYKDKTIIFEATPRKVCEKKGCWMILEDGKHQVRTLFKNYGFFVPKDIVGKKVRVQGVMEQKTVSAAEIRHFMKDEGRPLKDVKKVKTGQTKYQFTADAVEII